MRYFIVLALLCGAMSAISPAYASSDKSPGYVVTVSGDSLGGQLVVPSYDDELQTSVTLSNHAGTLKRFSIAELRRVYIKKTCLQKVKSGGEFRLMEVLYAGPVSLYRDRSRAHRLYAGQDTNVHELTYTRTERYVDNGYSRRWRMVELLSYQDTLRMLMDNRRDLWNDIEAITRPEEKKLIALLDKYKQATPPTSNSTDIPQLLIDGKISLYVGRNGQAEQYYIRKEKGRMVPLVYKWQADITGDGIRIASYSSKQGAFRDSLSKYMADAPAVQALAKQLNAPERKSLIRLVNEYNCYTGEEAFERAHAIKRLPGNFELIGGMNFVLNSNDDPATRFGLYVMSGIIPANHYVFVRTGLFAYKGNTPETDLYYTLQERDLVYFPPQITLRIPLQIEIRLPKHFVQPHLGVGYNYYYFTKTNKPYRQSIRPSVSVGIDVQVTRRVSLRVMGEAELKNKELMSWTPERMNRSQLFIGGLVRL